MLRCKKGDLAIVLKGSYSGHFVTVKEFIGTDTAYRITTGAYEMFNNLWVIEAPTIPLISGMRRIVLSDEYLLPIRPGDLKETEETEKEVESV